MEPPFFQRLGKQDLRDGGTQLLTEHAWLVNVGLDLWTLTFGSNFADVPTWTQKLA